MKLTIIITIPTALVVAVLLWGYWRKRQEKQRRRQGVTTIPVDASYMAAAGCLGVLGYLGLLFVLISLLFDLVEGSTVPGWLAWVVAIALLLGFFIMVGWAVFGIGSSFAPTRLVLDKQGIHLIIWRRTKIVIFWDRSWRLEQMTQQRRSRVPVFDYGTEYQLIMRISQFNKDLILAFDATGEEVGGLPPFEESGKVLRILDDAKWLRAEVERRHLGFDEGLHMPVGTESEPDEFAAETPSPALMTAIGFTEADLALNRQLLYGPTQVQPIQRDKILTLATYLVMAALFGVGIFYSIKRLWDGQSFQSAGPLLVVCLLTAGFCLLMALVSWFDLRSEIEIERISGRIQLQHYSQSGEYWLRVEDEAFQLTEAQYDALEDGSYYALYAARHSVGAQDARLLSAERLRNEKPAGKEA